MDILVELVNSAYRGDTSKVGWTTEADLLGGQRIDAERVQEILANSEMQVLVWPRASDPSEGLDACVLLERTGTRAYLGMLTVRPGLQNQGWGREMLETAEQWVATHWNSLAVEMTVISVRQELIQWYERRGYRKTGERRPFPMSDLRFGLPKVEHLEFIVMEKALN